MSVASFTEYVRLAESNHHEVRKEVHWKTESAYKRSTPVDDCATALSSHQDAYGWMVFHPVT